MPIGNTARDKGEITKYGGGIIKIREVNDSGTPINNAPVIDLGYIQESEFIDTVDFEAHNDETGEKVQETESNRTVKLTATLMQSGKNILDIAKDVRGRYYQVYYLSSKNINGKIQEIVFAIGRIKPAIQLNSLTKRIPIEISFLKNENNINVDIQGVYNGNAGNVTILANGYYEIVEQAET